EVDDGQVRGLQQRSDRAERRRRVPEQLDRPASEVNVAGEGQGDRPLAMTGSRPAHCSRRMTRGPRGPRSGCAASRARSAVGAASRRRERAKQRRNTENTDAESTDAESTDPKNTDPKNTDPENAGAKNTGANRRDGHLTRVDERPPAQTPEFVA